jgi:hypothetical protein
MFEDMAIGVLKMIDEENEDIVIGMILLQKIPLYKMDCLKMSVEADCKRFVALATVQNLITNIWNGTINSKTGWKYKLDVCFIF